MSRKLFEWRIHKKTKKKYIADEDDNIIQMHSTSIAVFIHINAPPAPPPPPPLFLFCFAETRFVNKVCTNSLCDQFIRSLIACFYLVCRDSFPYDHQFNCLTKFIVDVTQTPNLKVSFSCYYLFIYWNYLLYPQMKVGDILVSGPSRRRRTFWLVCAITQKRFRRFRSNLAHTCIWVRRGTLFKVTLNSQ